MLHNPYHSITHLPRSSPGRPQDPDSGLWPDSQANLAACELLECPGPLGLFQAKRIGRFLTNRWLG